MSVSSEIIGLAVMAIVGLYLCSLIFGFRKAHTRRKKEDLDQHSAKLVEKFLQEEQTKQLEAQMGVKLRKKNNPRDFKQSR